MSAADAAAAADSGTMMMLPPTFLTCLDVAQHPTVHHVLDESRTRSLEMFCPAVEPLGDGYTLSLPERLRPMVAHRFPS